MRIIFIVMLLLFVGRTEAQIFPVDTLFKNGDIANRINLVFLSDGYQANEMGKYITDVNALLNNMFNQVPFKHYKNYFNAFAIKVPSNQSGAKHPRTSPDNDCAPVPQLAVDNYFGSTFDYANIHRLLASTKMGTVVSVLHTNFPLYDQGFIVVNSPYYGGSGGDFAASSTHALSADVSIHEIGHSFARLGDEYWAGASYAAEKPNLTQQSNATLVKWANWVGTSGVGVYAHSESPTWFRPHQNCKMRFVNVPFCSVCNETFVEKIHSLVNPIDSYSPSQLNINFADEPLEFSVSYIEPQPNTMTVTWKRESNTFASNQNSVVVPVTSFTELETKISATVTDGTSLSRSTTHGTSHVYVIEWTITKEDPITGVQVRSEILEYEIKLFPNSVQCDLNFSYALPRSAKVSVSLQELSGKKVKTLVSGKQEPGEHSYTMDISGIAKSNTVYIMELRSDDLVTYKRFVKID